MSVVASVEDIKCSVSSKKEINKSILLTVGDLISQKEDCCDQIVSAANMVASKLSAQHDKLDEVLGALNDLQTALENNTGSSFFLEVEGTNTPYELRFWWDGSYANYTVYGSDDDVNFQSVFSSLDYPQSSSVDAKIVIDVSSQTIYQKYRISASNGISSITKDIELVAHPSVSSIVPSETGNYSVLASGYNFISWKWGLDTSDIGMGSVNLTGQSARAATDTLYFNAIAYGSSSHIATITTVSIVIQAAGTSAGQQCQGFDLYEIVANGHGGNQLGVLVEPNSATCGYIPLIDNDGDGVPSGSDPDDNDPNNPNPQP
jgi:hypothetical protein